MLRSAFLILTLLLFSCQNKESTSESESKDTALVNTRLELVHQWQINNPDILPSPLYTKVLDDTSLVVFDISMLSINHFSKDGELISKVGRRGRGPMEFQSVSPTSITAASDGTVAIADISNARITIYNVYDKEPVYLDLEPGWGTQLQWAGNKLMITTSLFSGDAGDLKMTYYDPDDQSMHELYNLALELSSDDPSSQIGCTFCFVRFDDDLNFYTAPGDTGYLVNKVITASDSVMEFKRGGLPPIRYSEEQRKAIEEMRKSIPVPSESEVDHEAPVFKKKIFNYYNDDQNRLWVLLNAQPGVVRKFDLFDETGTFLGSINSPEGYLSDFNDNRLTFRKSTDDPDEFIAELYEIRNE